MGRPSKGICDKQRQISDLCKRPPRNRARLWVNVYAKKYWRQYIFCAYRGTTVTNFSVFMWNYLDNYKRENWWLERSREWVFLIYFLIRGFRYMDKLIVYLLLPLFTVGCASSNKIETNKTADRTANIISSATKKVESWKLREHEKPHVYE